MLVLKMISMISFDHFLICQNIFYRLAGQEIGQDYNFPEELFSKGVVSQWSVLECIKNMNKLSLMCKESPLKKKKRN